MMPYSRLLQYLWLGIDNLPQTDILAYMFIFCIQSDVTKGSFISYYSFSLLLLINDINNTYLAKALFVE